MSNHHSPGGSPHVHPQGQVHLQGPQPFFQAADQSLKENQGILAGTVKLVGRLLLKTFVLLFTLVAWNGMTVLDIFRAKRAGRDFYSATMLCKLWGGLMLYLLWGSGLFFYFLLASGLLGAIGYVADWIIFAVLIGGGLLSRLSLLQLNAVFTPFFPTIYTRAMLFSGALAHADSVNAADKIAQVRELAAPRFGPYSILDLCTWIDWASLLIPVALTILATVKWAKGRKGYHGGDLEVRSFDLTEKGLIAAGLLVMLLGLPGAPAGVWILTALIGWMIFGQTKHATHNHFGGSGAVVT